MTSLLSIRIHCNGSESYKLDTILSFAHASFLFSVPDTKKKKNKYSTLALEACPQTLFSWNHMKSHRNPASLETPSWRPGAEAADPSPGLMFAPVLWSGSACQVPRDNPDYPHHRIFSIGGKERMTQCTEEENRWPITMLQLEWSCRNGRRTDPRPQKKN